MNEHISASKGQLIGGYGSAHFFPLIISFNRPFIILYLLFFAFFGFHGYQKVSKD